MSLDMRTVILSHIISSILCAAVIALLWQEQRRRLSGVGFWLANFTLQTAAAVLIVLRGAIPDWISIIGGNSLSIAGLLLLYVGLERFVAKPTSPVRHYGLLATFAAVMTYFAVVQPNLAARCITLSLGALATCFQGAWLMLRRVDAPLRSAARPVGLVFVVYCLVSLARVGVIGMVPPGNDFFRSDLLETLAVMLYQILFIALAFGLYLLVNRRLTMEMLDTLTARQRAAEALQESEARYRAIFENSTEAILFTAPDGRIFEANPAACRMLGRTVEEIRAAGRTGVVDLTDPRLVPALAERQRTGRFAGELTYLRQDGAPFPVEIVSTLFTDRQGQVRSTIFIRDITERKQAEAALRASEANQRQLAEENTRLLQEINHRVANNLSLLSSLIEWELAAEAITPDMQRVLDDLQRRIHSMARVHHLLSGVRWTPLDLEMLAEQVVAGVLSVSPIRESIACRIHSVGEPVYVTSKQAFKLALIFNELTTNSLKYAFQARSAGRLQVEIAAEGRGVHITVSDDGPGWPADVLAGQRQHVGLSLVRTIVEYEMQGTVTLHNAEGAVIVCRFVLESTEEERKAGAE